jgi:hypothetical protein
LVEREASICLKTHKSNLFHKPHSLSHSFQVFLYFCASWFLCNKIVITTCNSIYNPNLFFHRLLETTEESSLYPLLHLTSLVIGSVLNLSSFWLFSSYTLLIFHLQSIKSTLWALFSY